MVGEAIEPLNMLISTLALFLSPAERLRSRYAVNETDTGDLEYESNLFLQGLLVKRVGVCQCLYVNLRSIYVHLICINSIIFVYLSLHCDDSLDIFQVFFSDFRTYIIAIDNQ